MRISTNRSCVAITLIVLLGLLFSTAAAQAETPAPGWEVMGDTLPTNLAPGRYGPPRAVRL